MSRQRTTWRTAGAPPAMPIDPSAKADPDQDAYKNGDTSSWAEDPDPGPHNPVPPPAMPREAALARQATLRRAAKCVKLAESLLGPTASEDQVESQALAMMDWDESRVDASLSRFSDDLDLDLGEVSDDSLLLDDESDDFDSLDFDALDLDDDMSIAPLEWDAASYDPNQFDALDLDDSQGLSPEEFDDFDAEAVLATMEAEEEEKAAKTASLNHTAALEGRIARLEKNLSRVAGILAKMAGEDGESEDESEGESEDESEDESEGESESEGKTAGEADKDEPDEGEEEGEKEGKTAYEVSFDGLDPMSMVAGDNSLQQLYGKTAAEEAEEEAEKQAAKQAAMRAVKAGKNPASPKTLGSIRVASQKSPEEALEALWETAPSLKDLF